MMVDRKRHAQLVVFTKFSQKISTQLLTLLIIRAIVQLEQKRGVQREQKEQKVEYSRFSKELPIWSLETAKLRMKNKLEK